MDRQEDADAWPERMINVYANTMNMLLWCVKGLGVLIFTWTTVVLLGGFVSLLQKEDFWCLTAITLVQLAGDNTYRMRAAEILEHLCVGRYTEDDEHLKKLKKALLDAMPKVLRELLGYYGTTREGVQAATGNVTSCYSPQGSDLEEGRPLHDNNPRSKYSSCWENSEQHGNGALKEALLSLCVIVGCKFISTDPDQARRFDKIASKICSELGKKPVKTFSSLMEEAKEILNKNEAKQFATASDNFSSGG